MNQPGLEHGMWSDPGYVKQRPIRGGRERC
jgi:hypothetical protein